MIKLDNELQHHGIKGQKWGVRRYQNADGSLTAAGRKRYGEDRYEVRDDGSVEVQKGAELQRVIDGIMSYPHIKGQTYVSIGKNDNNQYMNILAQPKISTVLKLEAKTTLKAPPTKEAANMYFDILRKDKKALEEFKQMKSFAEDAGAVKDFDKSLNNMLKGTHTDKDAKELYTLANYLFVTRDQIPTSQQAFYRQLKANGYNMLRDEYDSLSGVVHSPLILLDGESSVTITSSTYVTKNMHKKAVKYVEQYQAKGEEYAKKRFGIV